MARGIPTYSTGTIAAGLRGTLLIAQIQTCIEAYLSAGTQAWTKTTIGATEFVYHSVGDRNLASGAGDTDVWLYLNFVLGASWNMYIDSARDYSPTSGAWANAYAKCFAAPATWAATITEVDDITWWCVINEYEIYFRFLQTGSATVRHFYIGDLIRPYSKTTNGIARLSAQVVGTGGPAVISVDRDISRNITVGQYVWVLNQTPDGVAIQNVDINVCQVTAKTTTSISVATITNTYAAGSLLGYDPAPVGTRASVTGPYFNCLLDGTGAGSNAGTFVGHSMLTSEFNVDPDPSGFYWAFDLGVKMNSAPRGYRGKCGILRVCPDTGISNGDILRFHFNNSDQWIMFTTTSSYYTNWSMIAGPGA